MGYEDYIKPELLILIPVLYLIGHFIKSTETIKDKYIPVILGFVGVFLSLLYVMATEGPSLMALFTAITQGILTAGAAVYTNELITQGGKDE